MKSRKKSIVIVIALMLIPIMYELLGERFIVLPIIAKGIIFICYAAVVVGIVNHIDKQK